jgi:hypothetical protein
MAQRNWHLSDVDSIIIVFIVWVRLLAVPTSSVDSFDAGILLLDSD